MKQIFKKDHKHLKVKDYIKSGDLFQLYKDNNSGIVWTSLDKNHKHEHYYLSEKYIPHKEKKGFFTIRYATFENYKDAQLHIKKLKTYKNKNLNELFENYLNSSEEFSTTLMSLKYFLRASPLV